MKKFEKTNDTKTQQLNKLFEANEVLNALPESIKKRLLKTINLDAEDLAAEVELASKDFEGFTQSKADNDVYSGSPGKGFTTGEPTDKEIEEIFG